MGRYTASGVQTLAATADTALTVLGTAAQRAHIYEVVFGNIGTPADLTSLYTCQRCTTAGTGTAVTPAQKDLADGAAVCVCAENHTVEPTYTASEEQLQIPLNHRATYRWVAGSGDEIVCPATANAGVGFWAAHASALTDYRAEAHWRE